MTSIIDLQSKVELLVDKYGHSAVELELARQKGKLGPEHKCTILINKGLHSFPDHIFQGDVYVFYNNSLDLTSSAQLHAFVSDRLMALRDFLLQKKWQDIHIVISGHAALCMQVKLAVYRITHIETTDWVFDGNGNYIPLRIPMREVLSRK